MNRRVFSTARALFHVKKSDFFYAIILGTTAGALTGTSALGALPAAYLAAGALFLYLAPFFLPPLAQAAALMTCGSVCALLQHSPAGAEMWRVLAFAALLCLSRRQWDFIPPLIVIAALWLIYLFAALTAFAVIGETAAHIFVPFSFSAAAVSCAEMIIVSLLGLLLCSQRANRFFLKSPQPVSSKLIATHLLGLPVLLLLSGLLFVLRNVPELHYEIFADGYQLSPSVIILFAVALLILSAFGVITARAFDRLFSILAENAVVDTKIITQPQHLLPIPAFEAARAVVAKTARDLQKSRKLAKDQTLELEHCRNTISGQAVGLEALSRLVDALPDACLALQVDGKIIAANSRLFSLLKLNAETVDYNDYTSLYREENPWHKDLEDTISWACWKLRSLLEDGPQVRYLRSVNHEYIQLFIHAELKSTYRGEAENTKTLPPPHQVVVFFVLRGIPDLRDFQLQLLSPNALELLGLQTRQACSTLKAQLNAILEQVTGTAAELAPLITALSSHSALQNAAKSVSALLARTDEIIRNAAETLLRLDKQIEPLGTSIEPLNLSVQVRHAVAYLCSLEGIEHAVEVSTESDREKLGGENIVNIPASDVDDIIIQTTAREAINFLSTLLCLVKNLLEQSADLKLLLDYELIGSGTADIITGSLPGRYARLVLRHSGQSIAAYMLSTDIPELDLRKNALQDIETALALFRHQVKAMGGFLSIQSSASKGTTITVYLPTLPDLLSRLSRKTQKPEEVFEVE
ncbi:MAG TPA: hypothetical protein PLP17_03470, partial [Oligoflexia bacterium]|nr:hypothetical protein [Oligoflexia bacterium]